MITEEAAEKNKIEQLESGIRLCEEAITKAEKYERLKDNKDWQAFLEDLKILSEQHEKQIKWAASMLPDAPNNGYVKQDALGKESYISSKADWIDFISRHEIERSECAKWIKEPDYVLRMAALSRDKLPLLKEKLKELQNVSSGNGAS